ncbi:MAG: hypothetical protein HQL32_03010, partial [Planctomycetes bacterium]|nr:hypothetical protein [Planctomycetota bacterium]
DFTLEGDLESSVISWSLSDQSGRFNLIRSEDDLSAKVKIKDLKYSGLVTLSVMKKSSGSETETISTEIEVFGAEALEIKGSQLDYKAIGGFSQASGNLVWDLGVILDGGSRLSNDSKQVLGEESVSLSDSYLSGAYTLSLGYDSPYLQQVGDDQVEVIQEGSPYGVTLTRPTNDTLLLSFQDVSSANQYPYYHVYFFSGSWKPEPVKIITKKKAKLVSEKGRSKSTLSDYRIVISSSDMIFATDDLVMFKVVAADSSDPSEANSSEYLEDFSKLKVTADDLIVIEAPADHPNAGLQVTPLNANGGGGCLLKGF